MFPVPEDSGTSLFERDCRVMDTMRRLFSVAVAGLMAWLALALTGCASGPTVVMEYDQDLIGGAFLSQDGKAYLLGKRRDYRLDAAPFRAYRALMEDGLGPAASCSGMRGELVQPRRDDFCGKVNGNYRLLFLESDISADQARAHGLTRHVAGSESAADLSHMQATKQAGACAPADGTAYYLATIQAKGDLVLLADRKALMARARLAQPMKLSLKSTVGGGRSVDVSEAIQTALIVPLYLLGGSDPASWR
jgi:hypothetical protein